MPFLPLSSDPLSLGNHATLHNIIAVNSLAATTSLWVDSNNRVRVGSVYMLPASDGAISQSIITDGSGGLTWADTGGAGSTGPTDTQILVDNSGGSFPVYVGFGAKGLATSSTGWEIYNLTYNSDNNVTSKKTALGSYDSRGTLSYT